MKLKLRRITLVTLCENQELEKSFVWVGTNMTTKNQQKHLSLSFT